MTGSEIDPQPTAEDEPPPIRPSDMLYAGLGCVGLLYESQLAYLKQQLEKPDPSERERQLTDGLQSAYLVAVDLFTTLAEHGWTDKLNSVDGTTPVGTAIRQLADEGKKLLRQLQEGNSTP